MTEVRLVEAAAQLFSRHGFKATTTREIAQLADLNEATLFRYFARKPDLFLAALESHISRLSMGRQLQVSLAQDDDPEVVVPQIVLFVLNSLLRQPELWHLIHVAGFEVPEADKRIRDHLGSIFDTLSGYFLRCCEKGTIRRIEPSLATFGLMGAVAAHHTFQGLFSPEQQRSTDLQQIVDAYTKFCLDGLKSPR